MRAELQGLNWQNRRGQRLPFEKIEAGLRGTGMNTFIKTMLVLDVNI